jgi:hypothetical protein
MGNFSLPLLMVLVSLWNSLFVFEYKVWKVDFKQKNHTLAYFNEKNITFQFGIYVPNFIPIDENEIQEDKRTMEAGRKTFV